MAQQKGKKNKTGRADAGKVDPNKKREQEEKNKVNVAKQEQTQKTRYVTDVAVKINEEEITKVDESR